MIEGCSIEACSQPTVKGMAQFSFLIKLRAGVGRIRSLLIVRQVASGISAVVWLRSQIVIVVDVAGGTRHIRMAKRQQEPGGAVIELRAQPTVKRMARCAKLWVERFPC
ncbi:MAG TPA: hypothetical protein VN879_09335 [Candidatus Acidoferrales bacterium]|nr:hypothetical protein [Candidatus Acidoferrales bacterium]